MDREPAEQQRSEQAYSRRELLASVGLGSAALLASGGCGDDRDAESGRQDSAVRRFHKRDDQEWKAVRAQFPLDPKYIHLAGLLIASQPAPVRAAVEKYRTELDRNPGLYLPDHNSALEAEVRQAAADYLGAHPHDIALTDSTTMGIALVYTGLQVRKGQELLTSRWDYYSTRKALQYKAREAGASYREIEPYRNIQSVSEEELVDTLIGAVRENTRVVAVTWVHSSSGLKMPVRRIADRLGEINSRRAEGDRVLLGVDGVHGLGVETATMRDLGCDFFMAGTHKWIFAPRGTGILWGNPQTRAALSPTIPTFTNGAGWGGLMTPGGFKAFEHRWAMTDAFRFHQELGKERIQERIHELARQLKAGLAEMRHVTLYTPMDENLSAGVVSFDIAGMNQDQVVARLRERNIVASTTPYSPSYARLTPCVFNSSGEIERTLSAIRDLA